MNSLTELRRVFRNMPGLYLVLLPDPDFTIAAASKEFLAVTHADDDVIGRPLRTVLPDGKPAPSEFASGTLQLCQSLQQVLATGKTQSLPALRFDISLPAHAGGGFDEHYWASVSAPVLSDSGEVLYIIYRAVDAAAKANRSAIDILESIGEGFFSLDRQWCFDYVNAAAHHILDRQPGELNGAVLWTAYPGLEDTPFEYHYRVTMEQRIHQSFTAFYAGQERWYEVSTFPAPEGMAVYSRDVTERKALEAERDRLSAESEAQRRMYETALDSTPDFVFIFGIDHRLLYANDALKKAWGVEDVLGKRWTDLGYESWHAELHDGEIDQVIGTLAPVRGQMPFTGTQGRRFYDYIFAPVLGAEGQVVAVAGTTRDITDRKADEDALRDQSERLAAADRAKDSFLATLAHELRNPLAPLLNGLELMHRGSGDPALLQRTHAMMERQVRQLIRLVDDLMEISRISRGTFSLQRTPVDAAAIVRSAVEASAPLLQARQHTLELQLPDTPLQLDGDEVRLVQILSNLLNNAGLYTDPGGHIRVVVQRDGEAGDVALISVSDNGNGIAADSLPRLFEMFSQGESCRPHAGAGLGIGLALSRRPAEMHGGTLEGFSAGLGQGSEFSLRLPGARARVLAPPAVAEEDAGVTGRRVLVVDDKQDAADSVSLLLASLGADARVAHGGRAGLALFDEWMPDVVLLDIGMPELDGYAVAAAIRQRPHGRAVTIAALTGWGQPHDRQRAAVAGFDHHLTKPADVQALLAVLSRCGPSDAWVGQ